MARGKKEKLSLEELVEQAVVKEEEQPYEVPSNWVWTRLEQVIGFPKEKYNPSIDNEDIRYIGLEHIQKNGGIIGSGFSNEISSTKNRFKKGDILYGRLRPYLNKHDIAQFEGVCSTDILVLRGRRQVCSNKFVNYYIDTEYVVGYAVDNSKGINLPRVSEKELAKMATPLPPLAEQQRIVDRIESLFEKLDAAKELAQNALDSFENRKAAVLHKAFTGELTAKWREENGVSLDSWEEKKLGDIATFIGGGTPSKSVGAYWNGRVKWASVKDIKGDFLYNTIDYITEEGLENSASNICEIDELLLVTRISPGKTIIAKDTIAINQDLKIIRSNICSRFLHYYFQTKEQEIISKSSGSTVLGIRLEILKEIMINIPSELEQNEIVNIVEQLLTNEQQAQELCNVIEKIDLMKKAILARAFRGELGTNNPEEESAMELLKEVLKEKL